MRHLVQKAFEDGGLGPWVRGDVVNITPAQAFWVERERPGTLQPLEPPPSEPPYVPVKTSQAQITTDVFKAVKIKGV